MTERQMCVNNFSKFALHSAEVGIEPVISNWKSSALHTIPHCTQFELEFLLG